MPAAQGRELVEDLDLARRVEIRDRLVEDDEGRPRGERPGEADRCTCPPESCPGSRRATAGSRPTVASTSSTRTCRSGTDRPVRWRSGSATIRPTAWRGLTAESGS